MADDAEHYREFAPAPDLRDFVACTWIKIVRHRGGPPLVPIIPDGCSDLITYGDGAPFVVGPDRVTRWAELRDGLVITGLRLRPGAMRVVFGPRADEMLGAHAALADLQRGADRLQHELEGARSLDDRLAALEGWTRSRLQRVPDRARAIVGACRSLAAAPQIAIDRIADELGIGVRTLHRDIVAACGYGPKTLQRIMRVQRALRAAHAAGPTARLGDVALVAGFADQAHMTRDFRSITGFTPTAYLRDWTTSELGRWLDDDLPPG